MEFEPINSVVYVGSRSGLVRQFVCSNWQAPAPDTFTMTVKVDMQKGGPVTAIHVVGNPNEGGFLFVGVSTARSAPPPGQPQPAGLVCFFSSAAQGTLEGHSGKVEAICSGGSPVYYLFTGGNDKTVRGWVADPASGVFRQEVHLGPEAGAHQHGITSMCVHGDFLFSADIGGHVMVWHVPSRVSGGRRVGTRLSTRRGALAEFLPVFLQLRLSFITSSLSLSPLEFPNQSGNLLQKVQEFRPHNSAISKCLFAEGCLFTASLDHRIRVWALYPPEQMGLQRVVRAEAPLMEQEGRGAGKDYGMALTCRVARDLNGQHVVLVAYNDSDVVRLYGPQPPKLQFRGFLSGVQDCRAIVAGPEGAGVLLTGTAGGNVLAWRFREGVGADTSGME
jgi:hypothetical protein